MRQKAVFNEAQRLRKSGKSYSMIAKDLSLPRSTVYYMLKTKVANEVGRPKIINKPQAKVINNAIRKLKSKGKVVSSRKLLNITRLRCSTRTIRRHLRSSNYKYREVKQKIQLSATNKARRIEIIKTWFKEKVDWNNVIFMDEKRFKFDGPDNFGTWMKPDEAVSRNKRQMGGGGVMVQACIGSDGYLRVVRVNGTIDGQHYREILSNVCAYLKNRYPVFTVAQDNATPHTCKIVQNWIRENSILSLKWPPYSPDLNLIEVVFKMISDNVYDGPQFSKNDDLWIAIVSAVETINSEKKHVIKNMYEAYEDRLFWVLENGGNIYQQK